MQPDQTVVIDYTQWKVVMCNNTYATVEKVGDEKQTKMISVNKYL